MKLIRLSFILLLICCTAFSVMAQKKSRKYVVTGYIGGFRGLVATEGINAEKLTHIIYAFVDVHDSVAVLTNLKTDSTNFRKLNLLKKKNPDLKILISIGGWAWSENFSDASLTPTSRAKFAKSSVDIIRKYKLDGVDIDWEYPGMKGEEGNIFRPEDKQNYTLLFKAIREELDRYGKETGQYHELTAAVGASQGFVDHTEMAEVGKILDYIYVMTYVFSGNNTSGHQTNLYPSKATPTANSSDKSMKIFQAAGVPPSKLVVGSGFSGKGWVVESATNNGLGQKALKPATGGSYTRIKDSLVNKQGYKRYWDKDAQAAYLWNADTKTFISYEDEASIKAKAKYIKKNKYGGIFFWQYTADPKEYLLSAMYKFLP